MLRDVILLEESVDLLLGSASDKKPCLGCGHRFENELQQLDLVFPVVTFVKGVDDDGDGALESPAFLGGHGQELAELGKKGFGKNAWPVFDRFRDCITT